MLDTYYLTRWACVFCGTFETGTRDRPDPAAKCVWCDEDLETIAQCRGETSRALPFTTDPRDESQTVRGTSIDQINTQTSDNRRRNHANGKSAGRRRSTSGDPVKQEYERLRYLRSKNHAGANDLSN